MEVFQLQFLLLSKVGYMFRFKMFQIDFENLKLTFVVMCLLSHI